jgi:hypothetical protein
MRHGMDNGEFTPGDAQQTTITIGTALEGTMLLWAYPPRCFNLENGCVLVWRCFSKD